MGVKLTLFEKLCWRLMAILESFWCKGLIESRVMLSEVNLPSVWGKLSQPSWGEGIADRSIVCPPFPLNQFILKRCHWVPHAEHPQDLLVVEAVSPECPSLQEHWMLPEQSTFSTKNMRILLGHESILESFCFVLLWRYGRRTNRYHIKSIKNSYDILEFFLLCLSIRRFSVSLWSLLYIGEVTVEFLGGMTPLIHRTLEQTTSQWPRLMSPWIRGGEGALSLQLKFWRAVNQEQIQGNSQLTPSSAILKALSSKTMLTNSFIILLSVLQE